MSRSAPGRSQLGRVVRSIRVPIGATPAPPCPHERTCVRLVRAEARRAARRGRSRARAENGAWRRPVNPPWDRAHGAPRLAAAAAPPRPRRYARQSVGLGPRSGARRMSSVAFTYGRAYGFVTERRKKIEVRGAVHVVLIRATLRDRGGDPPSTGFAISPDPSYSVPGRA